MAADEDNSDGSWSPGRPVAVPGNATHPLRWRLSRLGADRLPVCWSRSFGALRPTDGESLT